MRTQSRTPRLWRSKLKVILIVSFTYYGGFNTFDVSVVGLNEDTAVLIPAGEESEEEWVKTEYFDNEADEAMEEDNENHIVPDVEGLVDKVVVKKPKKTKKKRTSNPNSDSEEEETVVL